MKMPDFLTSGLWAITLSLGLIACSESTDTKSSADQPDTKGEVVTTTQKVATNPAPKVQDVFNVGPTVYVRALAIDEATNSLWIGSSLGAQEVDLSSFEIRNTFTRDDGLANEYVFAIGVDADGYKWFGTNAGGVSRYKDGDWKTFFPMHGLADYWVYSFANAKNGDLWIGTWAGVNLVDRKTEEFKTYVKELINEWVYGLGVDKQGQVWFGTEGGVSRFDGKSWRHWTHQDGLGISNGEQLPYSKNTGLGTRSRHDLGILSKGMTTYNPNYVFSILVDEKDDTIWAGTWGGGVGHLVDGQWHNLSESDGLAGNIVYSIAQDKDGNYWFGTNRGASRYDGKNWVNYSTHNGLPANDVYAISIAASGDIWVGTRGGVSRLTYKTTGNNK